MPPSTPRPLRPDDIVIQMADERTDTLEAFIGTLRSVEPDQPVSVTYLRDGDTRQSNVVPTAATR